MSTTPASNQELATKIALELTTLTLERLNVRVTHESIETFLNTSQLRDIIKNKMDMMEALDDCEEYILKSNSQINEIKQKFQETTAKWQACATKFFNAAVLRSTYEVPDYDTSEAIKMFKSIRMFSF